MLWNILVARNSSRV